MTAPPEDPRLTPHPPFGVRVRDVEEIVPDVQIVDDDAPFRRGSITVGAVGRWIDLAGELLDGRLADRVRILDPKRLLVINQACQQLVIWSTASNVEDAAHPTNPNVNSTAYGKALWDKYMTALADLEGLVGRWIVEGNVTDPAAGGGAGGGIFPPPYIPDWMSAGAGVLPGTEIAVAQGLYSAETSAFGPWLSPGFQW